jgi:excisionase family DNA binding protein
MSSHAGAPTGDPLEEVITARVAAREKGVHPVSIYRAIKEGRLKGARSGHTILIRRRDLAEWQPVGHRRRSESTRQEGPVSANGAATKEEEERLKQIQKNQGLIELLRKWREEGDEQEQREAFEALKQTLDEDRMGYRKIYP